MNERPILFNGEMVRAILAGRKTQTRRVFKFNAGSFFKDITGQVQAHFEFKTVYPMPKVGFVFWDSDASDSLREFSDKAYAESTAGYRCPYGEPGDRLWVRETFMVMDIGSFGRVKNTLLFRATDEEAVNMRWKPEFIKWKPSIFMPRNYSRLLLEIVSVRVERVQNISLQDAISEGMTCDLPFCNQQEEYEDLWNRIHKKRGFGWDTNPWVWVIEFKRVMS